MPEIMKVKIRLGRDAGPLERGFPDPVEVAPSGDATLCADEQPASESRLCEPGKVQFDVGPQCSRQADRALAGLRLWVAVDLRAVFHLGGSPAYPQFHRGEVE
ncbi:MAG TPA: hypothetical protein VGR06_34415, partial [Actinophytocola sp.]|nr:hypothetical protein [Actinophytocola sp.]